MDIIEIIKGRRSIRKYKPDPVSEETLRTILEAARWAPSWANTQCWEFIVVRNPETKSKLAGALSERNPAVRAIEEAPIVIAVCARLGISGFYKGRYVTEKGDWYLFDTALATQNLALAAHSLGLGTVHVGYFDAEKVAEILGVPDGVAVVVLMPLGYPLEMPKAPPRKELGDFVYYERYGQKAKGS